MVSSSISEVFQSLMLSNSKIQYFCVSTKLITYSLNTKYKIALCVCQ